MTDQEIIHRFHQYCETRQREQPHAPWQGEWILMARRANTAIEIDGLDSKELLEQFGTSLGREK